MKIQDMKEKMRLTKKYDRYASFKKYVVDVAHKELKELYHNKDKTKSYLLFFS